MNPIALFKCDLDPKAIAAASAVLSSNAIAAGPHVIGLEQDMSALFGGRQVVAMGDMTHALSMALTLSGVGVGDDVLVLSYNCLSSTSAISAVGARPVWLDIDPASGTVLLSEVKTVITPATKALVVYHVAGYPADLVALKTWADEQGVVLIEDANNALGAETGKVVIGTIGKFAVVSLYANRQINAIEGAVLVCEDAVAATEARRIRRFGIDVARFRDRDGEIDPAADVRAIGMSSSLTNVNAAIARVGLASLHGRIQQTRQNVAFLQDSLQGISALRFVSAGAGTKPAFWVCLVLCTHRDKLLQDLKRYGVQCSKLHHPNHLYSAFVSSERELPGTTKFMAQVLALPCGWWLSKDELQHIVKTVRKSLENIDNDSRNINHL